MEALLVSLAVIALLRGNLGFGEVPIFRVHATKGLTIRSGTTGTGARADLENQLSPRL
jgi:hypothetical protein